MLKIFEFLSGILSLFTGWKSDKKKKKEIDAHVKGKSYFSKYHNSNGKH